MRLPRLRVRTMLGLIAVAALALGIWENHFNASRRWMRAIRDDENGGRRWEAGMMALRGEVPGLDDALAVAALTAALDHPNFGVRENAARALARFGPRARSAIPALSRAL